MPTAESKPQAITWRLGHSAGKLPLEVVALLPASAAKALVPTAPERAGLDLSWLLILAGVHGDETEGVCLLEELRTRWMMRFPLARHGLILWTHANPDGIRVHERWNANHVDLNRNLPSKDWSSEVKNPRYPPGPAAASEPETQALLKLIEVTKPKAILSIHSFSKPQVNLSGPARAWAEHVAAVCKYPVTEDIGYPTPGSLGSYAGIERGIPLITLELERGQLKTEVLRHHAATLEAAIAYWEMEK